MLEFFCFFFTFFHLTIGHIAMSTTHIYIYIYIYIYINKIVLLLILQVVSYVIIFTINEI